MNTDIRYIFEKGSKKHVCPHCNKKRFVRYIDMVKGEYLPINYGRCDREVECGYHLNPYKDGYAKMIWKEEQGYSVNFRSKPSTYKPKPKPKKETTFIPVSELQKTLKNYDKNVFIQNLLTKVKFPFDVEDVETVISIYRLGTVASNGAVCFPFIDTRQNVRAIQEKIFDVTNHTDKSKKYHTSWLHSRLQYNEYKNKSLPNWLQNYLNNDTKVSCLFGEHLLSKYPHNPVAIVEAPKTAIYGTLYFGFPEQPTNFLWLSAFNLSSLNYEKCKVLKGRDVYLFPDTSKNGFAFNEWSKKAEEIQSKLSDTVFKVSDILEQLATDKDKEEGNDLADYLIEQDWRKYREQPQESKVDTKSVNVATDKSGEESEASKKYSFSNDEEQRGVGKEQDEKPIKENELVYITEEDQQEWEEIYQLQKANLLKQEIAAYPFEKAAEERRDFFDKLELPTDPVKLNEANTITDVRHYISSNLKILKKAPDYKTARIPLNRLDELEEVLAPKKSKRNTTAGNNSVKMKELIADDIFNSLDQF